MSLETYVTLMDRCDKLGLVSGLEWDKTGWRLEVFDDKGRVCGATSTKSVPACFEELAVNVAAGLYRSKKL